MVFSQSRSWSERIPFNPYERKPAGIVRLFSQSPGGLVTNDDPRYDFAKAELLKSGYFKDNIYCHFTASFVAVSQDPFFRDLFIFT